MVEFDCQMDPEIKKEWDELEFDEHFILTELQIDIVEQILEILEKRKISQREFAKILGVSEGYVSKLLKIPSNLTLKTLAKIAARLRVKIESPKFILPEEIKINIPMKYKSERNIYDPSKTMSDDLYNETELQDEEKAAAA